MCESQDRIFRVFISRELGFSSDFFTSGDAQVQHRDAVLAQLPALAEDFEALEEGGRVTWPAFEAHFGPPEAPLSVYFFRLEYDSCTLSSDIVWLSKRAFIVEMTSGFVYAVVRVFKLPTPRSGASAGRDQQPGSISRSRSAAPTDRCTVWIRLARPRAISFCYQYIAFTDSTFAANHSVHVAALFYFSQFAGSSFRRLIRTGSCSRWQPSFFSHLFRFISKASPPGI